MPKSFWEMPKNNETAWFAEWFMLAIWFVGPFLSVWLCWPVLLGCAYVMLILDKAIQRAVRRRILGSLEGREPRTGEEAARAAERRFRRYVAVVHIGIAVVALGVGIWQDMRHAGSV